MNVAAEMPTAPLEPRVGDRLGRLEILGHLADGGMARLWLARDNSRGVSRRWFAIKTVLPSLDASEYEEMLVEEAELASRVRHPNVVRTFGMGRHHGRPYIVQELIVGASVDRSLRKLSENGLRLPVGWVVQIGIGIARGLHGIHTATGPDGAGMGLVHRDVNPSNVLLSSDGVARIIDFGVAKSLRLRPRSSVAFKGTIRFAPPEQLRGHAIDLRADLHALGVMLHDSLTGERVFDHASFLELAERRGSAPALREREPEVPRELERLIEALTAGEAHRRPTSALEVAHALERIARDLSTPSSELLGRLARAARSERPARELGRLGLAAALTKSSGVRPLTRRRQDADEPTRDERRTPSSTPQRSTDIFDQPTTPFAAPYADTIRASAAAESPASPNAVVSRTFTSPSKRPTLAPPRLVVAEPEPEPDTMTDAWGAVETARGLDWDIASLRAASAMEAFAPEGVGESHAHGADVSSVVPPPSSATPAAPHATSFDPWLGGDGFDDEAPLTVPEYGAHEPSDGLVRVEHGSEAHRDGEPIFDAIFDAEEPTEHGAPTVDEPSESSLERRAGESESVREVGADSSTDRSSGEPPFEASSASTSFANPDAASLGAPKRRRRARRHAVHLPRVAVEPEGVDRGRLVRIGVAAWLFSCVVVVAAYLDLLAAAGWVMAGTLLVSWWLGLLGGRA